MSHSPLEFLRHILDELDFLVDVYSKFDESRFSADGLLQRAVARSLEVIGEASKRLGPEFHARYPDAPWSEMARMRDKLIHHYFGIDYVLVWNVIEVEVPALRSSIEAIIQKESNGT